VPGRDESSRSSTLNDSFEGDRVVMIMPPTSMPFVGRSRLGADVGINDGEEVFGRLVEPDGRVTTGLPAPLENGGFVSACETGVSKGSSGGCVDPIPLTPCLAGGPVTSSHCRRRRPPSLLQLRRQGSS
jgi:hypothetical protein